MCGPSLTPVIDDTALWQVRLNYTQNLPRKLLIVLKRHEEQVVKLSPEEWQELHAHVQRTTERLRRAFAPDHFNYAFLQNQDRHVHLHVIPRYATARLIAGLRFEDPDYPGQYSVPALERRVSAAALDELTQLLNDAYQRHRIAMRAHTLARRTNASNEADNLARRSRKGHSKRHSMTPTDGVRRRHIKDSRTISKWLIEKAKGIAALAWQARGRRFESAMLHHTSEFKNGLYHGRTSTVCTNSVATTVATPSKVLSAAAWRLRFDWRTVVVNLGLDAAPQ